VYEVKPKKVLVLGASDFQLPAIIKAKEMGLQVAVVDINSNAVGVQYADMFFPVSTIDEKGVLEAARSFSADGIITLCTDMPMRALAFTCEALNLPGLDYQSSICSTDKYKMIKAFEKANVDHPQYIVLRKGDCIDKVIYHLKYPVISKPIDNSGSRGIMLIHNADELKRAVEYSSNNGRNGDVIIEEYMQGPEVSVELMVIDGNPNVLQITDKYTSGNPHFVEIGHSQPSRHSDKLKKQIADLACRAAIAVGIRNGAGHAEIIITKEGPKMVEIGARMGGGCITTHLVPLSTGIDMTRATIEVALGKSPDIEAKYSRGAAILFILPKPGTVKMINGVNKAKAVPGITEVSVDCRIGQHLGELESGASRIGYVIATGATAEEAMSTCKVAHSLIDVVVE